MNPQHTLPTLDDGPGLIIWDSHAICTYLIDKYGRNDHLYPKDLYVRARINQRLYFDVGVAFAALRPIIGAVFSGASKYPDEGIKGIYAAYDFLETFLKDDLFMVGNKITVADYCLVATISTLQIIVPISEDKYPKLADWFARIKSVPFYHEVNGQFIEKFRQFIDSKLESNKAAAELNNTSVESNTPAPVNDETNNLTDAPNNVNDKSEETKETPEEPSKTLEEPIEVVKESNDTEEKSDIVVKAVEDSNEIDKESTGSDEKLNETVTEPIRPTDQKSNKSSEEPNKDSDESDKGTATNNAVNEPKKNAEESNVVSENSSNITVESENGVESNGTAPEPSEDIKEEDIKESHLEKSNDAHNDTDTTAAESTKLNGDNKNHAAAVHNEA